MECTDGEHKVKRKAATLDTEEGKKPRDASREKVKILIEKEYAEAGDKRYGKSDALDLTALGFLYNIRCYPRHERRAEDKNDKLCLITHIKVVAGYKEHRPLTAFRKNKIEESHNRIKNQKFYRIKGHLPHSSSFLIL